MARAFAIGLAFAEGFAFPEFEVVGAGIVGGTDAIAASLVTTVFGRPFGFGFGDFGVVVVVVTVFPYVMCTDAFQSDEMMKS